MRLKIILAVNLIAVVIIILGAVAGLFFTQKSLDKTAENDMAVVASIADELITTRINLLKANAATAARHLIEADSSEFHEVLEQQVKAYQGFMALTVFDRNGVVDSAGKAPTPAELLHEPYVQWAFVGVSLISTTRLDPSGELVFHICVPMGERVLSVTISGMFFSNLLSNYKIWETGHIFMDDADGFVIASIRSEWVLNRYNFIKMASADSQYQSVADTVRQMISGETGVGRFTIGGVEFFCAYRPIQGSHGRWYLGVVAPVMESPVRDVRRGLLLVGGVCLLLSLSASLFTSSLLERPYKKVKEIVAALERQAKLLKTTNDAAAKLLRSEADHFERDLWDCMGMVAACVDVDRVRIWKNQAKNGQLYRAQLYGWSGEMGAQLDNQFTTEVAYNIAFPGWEEKLSAGQCINDRVRHLSPAEQARLMPQGILSLLVIPVFVKKKFWGFVGFDDCHREREFSSDDESLLHSTCLLVANAILNNEMTQNLIHAQEAALSSAAAKGDFLANMSHEMRTPLNAIIGLSELSLDMEDVQGDVRENLEKVYKSGMTLLSLVNDILDISKIESGKFELVPIEYDTPSLINDTTTLNIVRIGSKPIRFNLQVDETLPHKLFGDELRVKQICNNLLSNAFKYTRAGVVEWRVSCELDGDSAWLVFRVSDSGIGIRQEDLKKLFSDYNQVDTKSNRKVEGTGLGLAITKRLLEMMDGTITVESEYGKGSVFTARIRQKYTMDTPIGAKVAENLKNFHYTDRKRDRSAKLVRVHIPYAKVLVVDDVMTNLDVAKGMLKPYGMQVDCVSGGPAAIELMRAERVKYNAIFMDHMMPEIDGIEATRIIREEIGTDYAKNIPVIVLTANAIAGNEEMFLRSGFQAFLSKPIDILRLDAVVNQWVRDKALEKELLENHGQTENMDRRGRTDRRSRNDRRKEADRRSGLDRRESGIWKIIDGLDFKKGLERFGGDEETYVEVLESYVLNTPPLLDKISECTEGYLSGYAVIVHGIKGSSLSIGAGPVGALAETLEFAAKRGDFTFVSANNGAFIQEARDLIAGLSAALRIVRGNAPKPKKAEPDASVLAGLLKACEGYDIDGVDQAMGVLESYEYESGAELVAWLREQVNVMGFKQIQEHLSRQGEPESEGDADSRGL